MDISQATKEPLPSHGQHQSSLEETATCHRCQALPHPHQRAASTSSAETTEERVAHHKNEADPRRRSLAEHKIWKLLNRKGPSIVIDALELLRSDAPKEDTTWNAAAACPKIETRFSPGDLLGYERMP
uniref:Uncharacterized protein n=1 Tax=Oryza meridionalis TaxID=40149 RepID=A0A0E0EBM3_9ORYZ